MQYLGTIVSFDQQTQSGLVTLEGALDSVVFFATDVRFDARGKYIGRKVTFEVIQTPNGPLGVNLQKFGRVDFSPGAFAGALVAVAVVVGLTFACTTYAQVSVLLAYVLSVNTVVAVLVLFGGSLTQRSNVADLTLWGLALGGGALALLLTFSRYYGRYRKDATRLLVAVFVVLHVFAIRSLEPELLSRDTLRRLRATIIGNKVPDEDNGRRSQ